VEADEVDSNTTSFVRPVGLYELWTLPFCSSNAPTTFHRLMQLALLDLFPSKCSVDLNDFIAHYPSSHKDLANLRVILDHLHQVCLKLSPAECTLKQK
ncbi:uncharacterized protein DEA37_0013643, partial [Paragonimus westermani]